MREWAYLADRASNSVGTPCYIVDELRIRRSLTDLHALETSVPLKHWLSLKTQPVERLVQAAIELGLGIDVVSDYELHGAVSAGVPGNRILVNGIGKHTWLPKYRIHDLSVHFDSVAEVLSLKENAKALNWRVGLRCAIPSFDGGSLDAGDSGWDQFGMTEKEVKLAAVLLANAGVKVQGLHFHVHTNVGSVEIYRHAFDYVAGVSHRTMLQPEYVDIGGGLPVTGECTLQGCSAASTFNMQDFRDFLASVASVIPSVKELWLENGRFLTGPSGALVMSVIERKERNGDAYVICDGGRVTHARMASIEKHEILLIPPRGGPLTKTAICGPTCSPVDTLGCWMLSKSVQPGDQIVWLNAGAYHIPLETRFSHGLAPVVWFNQRHESEIIRRRELPSEWWGQWVSSLRTN